MKITSVLKQFVWLRRYWSISTVTPNYRWFFYHIIRSTVNAKIFSCLQKRPWTERTFSSFLPQPPCCTSIHGLMNVHGFCVFWGWWEYWKFSRKRFCNQVMMVASTVPCSNVYLSVCLATIQPSNQPTAPLTGFLLYLYTAEITCSLNAEYATLPKKINDHTRNYINVFVQTTFVLSFINLLRYVCLLLE